MSKLNRRDFLAFTGTSLIGLTLGGISLKASAQEKIELDNPSAKALQYVHKSAVEGEQCSNCSYVQGEDGQQWRPCALFPGKLVNNQGWCAAFNKTAG